LKRKRARSVNSFAKAFLRRFYYPFDFFSSHHASPLCVLSMTIVSVFGEDAVPCCKPTTHLIDARRMASHPCIIKLYGATELEAKDALDFFRIAHHHSIARTWSWHQVLPSDRVRSVHIFSSLPVLFPLHALPLSSPKETSRPRPRPRSLALGRGHRVSPALPLTCLRCHLFVRGGLHRPTSPSHLSPVVCPS
jgi:hypothetical protein